MIQAKFGLPGIALRTLEVYTTATLEATLAARADVAPGGATMDRLSPRRARRSGSVVYDDPRFIDYFRAATPEAELDAINIGSRPARRAGGRRCQSLRAIPWQFAWTQTRLLLPSWLGVEERSMASRAATRDLPRDVSRVAVLPVDDRADRNGAGEGGCRDCGALRSAAGAAGSAADSAAMLRRRLERAIDAVLAITGHQRLLDDNPVLRRSIDVRNPYVDPINESIHIIREVVAEFERPVMLYSIGKDSSVLLRLAQKAFYPGPIPFPLLHIDTSYKFREMIEFRDWYARESARG